MVLLQTGAVAELASATEFTVKSSRSLICFSYRPSWQERCFAGFPGPQLGVNTDDGGALFVHVLTSFKEFWK